MADDVLHSGVRGVTDLIMMPGLINLDFADIKTVMSEMGKAMMGTGEAEGEERALKAAEAAISNPLLDDVSMKGARGVLINITGGPDMMLFEVDQAANRIRAEVDPDANIIFGGTILENMEGRLRVSVVATGIEAESISRMPQNVEPLRPRMKAQPLPPRTDTRPVASNAVHHQMEALAQELNAVPAQPISPAEPLILGDVETPMVEDDMEPIPAAIQPMQTMRPASQPEPEDAPRRRFGFLGRKEKKPEPARMEPSPMPRPAPRATAQVMARTPAVEPQRTQQPQKNVAEDLFPEAAKDDKFEIPAFLRRQTN